MAPASPTATTLRHGRVRVYPPDDRRQDVHHRSGVHRRVQPRSAADVLAVDEHVDVPAQRPGLVAHPHVEPRAGLRGGIEHPAQRRRCHHLDPQLGHAPGVVAQHAGQDDPHPAGGHGTTATRTHSTSGSCSMMRVKLAPSSVEAKTSPLRVPT